MNCIDRFISGNSPSESEHKIPAGFLQTGPGSTSNDVLFTQIQEIADEKEGVCFALLNSSQCHNLKTVLKSLIQIIIRTDQDDDDEITCDGEAGGPKGLNYDLQMLYNWFEARDIERCVITFPDSEAMSTLVLTDFLTLLRCACYYFIDPHLSFLIWKKLMAGSSSLHFNIRSRQLRGPLQEQSTV